MIKAVLFDLGDTLWHFPNMPPHIVIREETVRRINALLRTWGIDPEGGLLFLGRDIRVAVERLTAEAYQTDFVSPDYVDLCAEVAGSFGLRLTDEQAHELWDAWNLGGQFFGRTLFPDALDTLRWLQERGFKLGSVTDRAFGGPRFMAELEEYGLGGFFGVVTISSDVGYLKPHPKIFQHALEALGVTAGGDGDGGRLAALRRGRRQEPGHGRRLEAPAAERTDGGGRRQGGGNRRGRPRLHHR